MRFRGSVSIVLMSVLWMVFLCGPVQSGKEIPVLTLRESIDLALKQSVVIHSAREGVKASESKKKEAFTGFLPRLSTYYSYTRYNEPPQSKSAVTTPAYSPVQVGTADNYNWAVEMRQPVFAGGGIKANYDISRIGEDVSRMDQAATIQDIVRDVGVTYFNILKTERMLGVAKQSLEQLEAHRNVAQQFYNAGVIPKNDLASVRGSTRQRPAVSCQCGKQSRACKIAVQHSAAAGPEYAHEGGGYSSVRGLYGGSPGMSENGPGSETGDQGLCAPGGTGPESR